MPSASIIGFAFVLVSQHDVIEYQEVLTRGIVFRWVGYVLNVVTKRCINASFTWSIVIVDKFFRIISSGKLILIFEEFIDLVLRETLFKCTFHDPVLGLVQASTAHCKRVVIKHAWVQKEIVEQRRLSIAAFTNNDCTNALFWK